MNDVFLNSRVGHCIYVWGAQGEVNPSKEWIKKHAKTKKAADDAIAMMGVIQKKYPGEPVYAYDCSGLVIEWMRSMYENVKDKTADGIKDTYCTNLIPRCKPYTSAYLYGVHPGCLVFRYAKSTTKAVHVGVVVDGRYVIHAKGAAYGVVHEPLRPEEWDSSARLISDFFYVPSVLHVKRGDIGVGVSVLQAAINYAVLQGYLPPKSEIYVDGAYGPKTEAAFNSIYDIIPSTADAYSWLMCGLSKGG